MRSITVGIFCVCALGWMGGSVVRGQSLFYSSWGANSETAVRRLEVGAGTQQVVVSGSGGNVGPQPWNFGPVGMAVDVQRGDVYYADANGHSIGRMKWDGSGRTNVVTGLAEPEDVAVDSVRGKIFWTDTGTDQIRSANLDGSNAQTLVSTGLLQASGLAIDSVRGRLYWSDYHTDKIGSVNLDGTGLVTWSTPGGGAIDVVIDQKNQKVIWSDFDTYRIYRSNLDGTGIEAITATKAIDLPGSLAIDEEQLYCVDWGRHALYRCGLDGSGLTQVFSDGGFSSLSGLVVVPEPAGVVGVMVVSGVLGRRRMKR